MLGLWINRSIAHILQIDYSRIACTLLPVGYLPGLFFDPEAVGSILL
jgi:hypothetical protein